MTIQEVKEKLCYYDTRNPDNVVIHGFSEQEIKEEGYGEHKEENCFCDNCFCGLTELAEELLKYKMKEHDKNNRIHHRE